jgi:hypothetical protein
MIQRLKQFNNWLQKRYKLGFVINYPFRTSVSIAKDYFKNKEIVAIEIGTFKGENALNILQQLNIKKLYIIDPYEEYDSYKSDVSSKNANQNLNIAKKRLSKYNDKIIWIRKFSEKALKDIHEKADFIYIDGNHDYKYVKKDMLLYWPILNKHGLMAGHDVPYTSVLRAFCEFVHEHAPLDPHVWNMDWWVFKN